MIDNEILNKLERLSYIKIDPLKREDIKSDMNEILKFVENLNQLNITDDSIINTNTLKLRDDIVIQNNTGEKVLESAQKSHNNFFVVPRIIE